MNMIKLDPGFGKSSQMSQSASQRGKAKDEDDTFANMIALDHRSERADVAVAKDGRQTQSRQKEGESDKKESPDQETQSSSSQEEVQSSSEPTVTTSAAVVEADLVDPLADLAQDALDAQALASSVVTEAPVEEIVATQVVSQEETVVEKDDFSDEEAAAAAIYATLTTPGMSQTTVLAAPEEEIAPVIEADQGSTLVATDDSQVITEGVTEVDASLNLTSEVGPLGIEHDSVTMDEGMKVMIKAGPFVRITGTAVLGENELPTLVVGAFGQKLVHADHLQLIGGGRMIDKTLPLPEVPIDVESLQMQIRDTLRVAIRDRSRSAELTLEPPDWGRLNIKIQVTRSEVNLNFTATNERVKETLEGSADELRKALANQGLHLGQLNVGLNQNGRGQEGQDFIAVEDAEKIKKANNPRLSRLSKWAQSGATSVDRVV